jgi:hypothetical protein
LYKERELTRNIRLRRLQWVGHVMIDESVPKKGLKGHIEGRRPVGRSRERWLDALDRDTKSMLKCRNWSKSAEDRDARRRRTEESKAQVPGCSTVEEEEEEGLDHSTDHKCNTLFPIHHFTPKVPHTIDLVVLEIKYADRQASISRIHFMHLCNRR